MENAELIEFTDEEGRLLLIAPRPEAERLGLRHKLVGVALRGSGGRFLIRRRTPAAWSDARLDLSGVAYVRPGEAWEDAALRSLGLAHPAAPADSDSGSGGSASSDPAASPCARNAAAGDAVLSLVQVAAFSLDEAPRRQVTVYLATQNGLFLSTNEGGCDEKSEPAAFSEGSDLRGEALLLDRDELEGLAAHSPELLTPGLLWTLRSGCLWSRPGAM